MCIMAMNDQDADIVARNATMIAELRKDPRCDPAVLDVMSRIDRARFLPKQVPSETLGMRPIQIGYGQTMSAPNIVASMTSLLELRPGLRVLEIGTGCGYQTAVLSGMGAVVYSVEYIPQLTELAASNLEGMGFQNYQLHCGDGYHGWKDQAPFDRILAAARAPRIPAPWLSQLNDGGIIVIPVEKDGKEYMVKAVKRNGSLTMEWLYGVRFVPFVGKIRE